jgi:hypothetical protein
MENPGQFRVEINTLSRFRVYAPIRMRLNNSFG